MNILNVVDNYLENPYFKRTYHSRNRHYPSQASCLIKNEYGEEIVAGSCLRTIYWESKNIKKTNPMTARGIRITKVGKMVEQFEVGLYKELGIWVANNVKYYNEQHNVSGEIDCLISDKELKQLIGIEIKTGYGYQFQSKVLGTPKRSGQPKFNHLLQVMLYIDHFKIPFKMVYIDRGNAQRSEFNITLNTDGTANIDNKKLNNGISIPRCLARFKEVEECIENGTLPKRDFQLNYSQERVEFLYASKRLNKAQQKEFERNKKVTIGDWNCSYCSYKDYCWKGNMNEKNT